MKKIIKIILFVVIILCYSNIVFATDDIDIIFKDKNMYSKVCLELENLIKEKDVDSLKIIIEEKNIEKITNLNLRNGQISNISGIEKFVYLEVLDLSQNKINNIQDLKDLVNLEELNLYDNVILDLSGLEKLINLKTLKLGENNEIKKQEMKNLQVLNNLQNLIYLDFAENYTPTIIQNIDKLEKLEYLTLEQNNISDLSKIENLKNLKFLNLYQNNFSDISKLYELPNLENLIIQGTKITDISGMLNNNKELVWEKIKKLDIARNKIDTNVSKEVIKYLCDKSNSNLLELNYEYIIDTSNLPHYDENGVAYVTYNDFGARCDGEYDDFIAIRNTHSFANRIGCEVRAVDEYTYHIYKLYEDAADIKTNVDWQNATFIIHDEKIEETSAKNKYLFLVNTIMNETTINNPKWTINKKTTQIPELKEILNSLGYKNYLCIAINKDKKQYIRYGSNANSGASQQDMFIMDNNANILDDIIWDFDKITSFTIYPIEDRNYEMKNAKFISNALESKTDTPYTRAGTNKPIYYSRSIALNKCANFKISNIHHTLSTSENDDFSGSYYGFIYARNCANLEITDCSFFDRKYSTPGRSTYELMIKNTVNLVCRNLTSNDIYNSNRWSTTDVSTSKNLLYENCRVNKIGSHEGVYNVTINNCEVGARMLAFIGQGELNIINTRVSANEFINLRSDYGSSWDGNINIINCTYRYLGGYAPKLFNFKFNYDDSENKIIHDYGYEPKFPNVYVEDFTIDFENVTAYSDFYIIPNFSSMMGIPYNGNSNYWAEKIYINNYKIINDSKNSKLRLLALEIDKKENVEYNYFVGNVKINKGEENITAKCLEDYTSNENINLEVKENKIFTNTISIYKDDKVLLENEKIKDTFKMEFEEEGEYRIYVDSIDNLSNTGYAEYKFKIEKSEDLKGDIDSDGIVSVNDVAILKSYIIGKQELTEEMKKTADIDNDGNVSINDLAIIKLILIEE